MKIVFFAPHAAIDAHAFPEALIAETLKHNGFDVVYVTCGSVFKKYCHSMSAKGLRQESSDQEKQKVCAQCIQKKKFIKKTLQFKGYDLEELLTIEDYVNATNISNNIGLEEFLDLSLEKIPVGRIALYEFLLQHKKFDFSMSKEEFSRYKISLYNTLLSFLACKKIIEKENPQFWITYNSLYAVNSVGCLLAKSNGISQYFLHTGLNLSNRMSRMIIAKETTFDYYKNLVEVWPKINEQTISTKALTQVTDHFLELLKGSNAFVYSRPKSSHHLSIKKNFNVSPDQKLLVATMSSYDERFAGESIGVIPKHTQLLFRDQLDWIKSLIRHVEARPDLFLIIRVHPREFPNKRETVLSDHAQKIQKEFQALPTNIKVNWPADKLSLYDMVDETDVFLNAWSSVGEEMSLLGIPVVIYAKEIILYPEDLNYLAKDKNDYFKKIDLALTEGWSFERIRKTYRWYALKFVDSAISLHDSVHLSDTTWINKIRFISQAITYIHNKYLAKIFKLKPSYILSLHVDYFFRKKKLKESKRIVDSFKNPENIYLHLVHHKKSTEMTLKEETLQIKKELRRILKKLYSGSPSNISNQVLRKKLEQAL